MNIEKKHRSAFKVVGLGVETTNTREASPESALIPGLWQQFFSDNIDNQISNKTTNESILGVYWNYQGDQEKSYRLLAGREVSSLDNVPPGLTAIEVPESDYLVFSDQGEMPQIIYSMWQAIWDYFANNNIHQRQYSFDFECYSNDPASRVEIYVAIKS